MLRTSNHSNANKEHQHMTIYNTPYTYLIGWTKHDKWYYGVRFAKNCHPKDLWITYFTSSKYVKKFRKEYGEPDIIEVRKIFSCSQKAREWETKVIVKMNIVESENWLNKTDNTNKFFHEGTRDSFSEEHRKNLSIAASKRKRSVEHICKLNEGRKQSKNSESHRAAIREFQKKRIESGYYQSEIHKETMSQARMLIEPETRKVIAKKAGKESQRKRIESGYYQSEEWKEICRKIWEKRRKSKLGG